MSESQPSPLSQSRTPLISQIDSLVKSEDTPFYAPGHKHGRGITPELSALLGEKVFKADLPELPALDNLFAPAGVLQQARVLAAEAFGADETWFLVNGSTVGIQAAILATCSPGDKIILPRNVHRSAIAGAILSGALPIFITPEYDPELDLTLSLAPEAVERALQQHPDARAILVVYPTYQGICGDLEAIAAIAGKFAVPLLVDEAHGAHFAFHDDLPPSALSLGADLVVQSTHKVLGALTQASLLHRRGDRVDPRRVANALQLLLTTSPSYLLLASLDGARKQMGTEGRDLLTRTLELAGVAGREIAAIPGLSVLSFPFPVAGCRWFDRTRLTLGTAGLGITGYELDDILQERFQIAAELPSRSHLTFILSLGNTREHIDRLVVACRQIAREYPRVPLPVATSVPFPASVALSPREAFFAATETVPREEAIDRVGAELICPYPPGIPALIPGEIISIEILEYLRTILELGGTITGCSDATLRTLVVIARSPREKK